ncbi:hypothetical protein NKW43_01500 [Gluconobacter albidus]|uniref:hypothetical protein n=1 Tax=Gluconobacter albidus TaxID=318683 RepID=UPI00209F2AC4|nr:hypothetical protein [Gluconobacter albidus]MCP1272351.1 hypothetical protein [Gluconobacter albidus]
MTSKEKTEWLMRRVSWLDDRVAELTDIVHRDLCSRSHAGAHEEAEDCVISERLHHAERLLLKQEHAGRSADGA